MNATLAGLRRQVYILIAVGVVIAIITAFTH
jgi:hypothetical protein